ncbi:hypothetical protein [Bradyrhizobium liaoningense]|uniref:hypothetical protein n=1 Tax=Bradyrhizobium liaoningense TaxID=43992 RepID=UPI001BA4EACF|nr:hypothetical protein [Bradyrhizobium liaoningense]MBR0947787.1 hypothetical protein [Bradyrhizobium liaoningense]
MARQWALRYRRDPAFNAYERHRNRLKKKWRGNYDQLLRVAIRRDGRSLKGGSDTAPQRCRPMASISNANSPEA